MEEETVTKKKPEKRIILFPTKQNIQEGVVGVTEFRTQTETGQTISEEIMFSELSSFFENDLPNTFAFKGILKREDESFYVEGRIEIGTEKESFVLINKEPKELPE
jgi:hypothetical protein